MQSPRTQAAPRTPRLALLVGFLALAAVWPAGILAQSQDTGSLQVAVLDPDGASLAGVAVRLFGPQNDRLAETGADSIARFWGLVPGIYSAEAVAQSFRSARHDEIVITTGATTRVDIRLEVSGIEEVLVVEGASPLIDPRAVHVGATVSDDLINLTPSGSGLWNGVLDKVPGLVLSGVDVGGGNASQQQAFSAHGSLQGQNEINLNGSPADDRSSGGAGMYYGVPAFAEVQVSTAAHDIRHQTAGVIVNMVSKSGSNQWRGAGRFYYSDSALAGDNVSDELLEQGVRQGNPNTLLADLDLQAGGPILRDRLWAFVDYSRFDEHRLIIGLTEADQDERNLRNITANVDWQLTPDHRLSLRYFYSDKFRLNFGAGPDWPAASSQLQDPSTNHVGQLNWLSRWSENTFADVRASYREGTYAFVGRGPDSAAPHPDFPAGIPSTYDFFTGTSSGMPRETQFWDQDYGVNFNVSHAITSDGVSHDVRIGGVWRDTRRWRVGIDALGVSQWLYGGVPDSVDLFTSPGVGLAELSREDGTIEGTRQLSLYVQDSVQIGPRWQITAGLRWDYSKLWIPEQRQPDSWWAGLIDDDEFGAAFRARTFAAQDIIDWGDLVPRIAMTYDLSGRGTTLLKASYGQYSMQQNSSLARLVNPRGDGFNEYLWDDLNGDGVFQWGEQGDLYDASHPGVNTAFDPDLKSSRTHEITAGIEHQTRSDLVLGATLIYRTVSNSVGWINTGVPFGPVAERLGVEDSYVPVETIDPGPDGIVGTADDGGVMTVWSQDPGTFGQNFFLITNPERWGFDAGYDYRALELTARKRFANRWQVLGSWSIGRIDSGLNGSSGSTTRGTFSNPNALINRIGRAREDRAHIIKLNASYLFADPVGVNVGVSLRHESGMPVSRRFRLDRGIVNQGRITLLAAPLGTDDNPASLGGRLSSITLLDLRAEKQFALPGSWGRMTLTFDAFNILNENAERSVIDFAGPAYGRIRQIVPPRMLRLGLGWIF